MAGERHLPHVGPGAHRPLRRAGAASAAMLAGIHLDRLAPAAREATYLGVLFAVAIASFGWVAVSLFQSDGVEAWVAGAGLAVAVAIGYVLSCTVGLPGITPERWSALGDGSVALDAVVVALALARSRAVRREERLHEPGRRRDRTQP